MYCLTLKLLIHLLFFYRIFNLEKKVVETENPFFASAALSAGKKFFCRPSFFHTLEKISIPIFTVEKKGGGKTTDASDLRRKRPKRKTLVPSSFPLNLWLSRISEIAFISPEKKKKSPFLFFLSRIYLSITWEEKEEIN